VTGPTTTKVVTTTRTVTVPTTVTQTQTVTVSTLPSHLARQAGPH
jgi:hypothetical protein